MEDAQKGRESQRGGREKEGEEGFMDAWRGGSRKQEGGSEGARE